MNTNERLDLIERVDHASEDQAKLTLKFMILKCTVKQNTIARAIKEAIERHTPTPTIVYQQPETVDDDEAALTSSHRKSQKKKKDHDGGGQDKVDESSTVSTRRRSTRRGDINADRLVEKLILKKSKRNKKHSSDHDEEQNSPDASKKNKPKHVPKPGDETEQPAHENSMGQPSKQKQPTIIDLVTSSEDETYGNLQSDSESLDQSSDNDASDNENSDDSPAKDSSDGDSSEDVSMEDDSLDLVSSDDEGTGSEQQGDAITGDSEPSHDGSNKKTTQASTGGGQVGRDAARSITISMAKTSIQNDGIKMRPSGLTKKRKAPEQTVEEAHNDHAAQTATDTQANKRPKRNQPNEPHFPSENRKCRDCGVLFPSIGQLVGHRLYCKSAVITPTADTPADYNVTDETGDLAQLRAHPNGGVQAAQMLSASQVGFDTPPTNGCVDTDHSPVAPARWDSKAKATSYKLPLRSASPAAAESGPPIVPRRLPLHNKSFVEKLEPLMQLIHRCRRCGKYYDFSHNEAGDCQKGHTGFYRNRFPLGMPTSALRDDKPCERYSRWSCCGQQAKDAPACHPGKAVKHTSGGRVKMSNYEKSPQLRRAMQRFL